MINAPSYFLDAPPRILSISPNINIGFHNLINVSPPIMNVPRHSFNDSPQPFGVSINIFSFFRESEICFRYHFPALPLVFD
jgi:hypothetical protein